MGVTLYHYTSVDNAKSILSSRRIKQSGDYLPRGAGVYLTQVPPTAGKTRILVNNYDGKSWYMVEKIFKERTDHVAVYFVFDSDDIGAEKQYNTIMNRNEWIVRNDIDLDKVDFTFDYRFDREYFTEDEIQQMQVHITSVQVAVTYYPS